MCLDYTAELMIRMVQESWSVTMVKYGHTLYTLRINTSFFLPQSRVDYFYQVSVTFHFKSKTSNGFPSKQEDKSLTVVEEALLDAFHGKNKAVLVGVVTGNNIREFLLYTSDHCKFRSEIEKTLHDTGYVYELTIQEDREWSVYESFYRK